MHLGTYSIGPDYLQGIGVKAVQGTTAAHIHTIVVHGRGGSGATRHRPGALYALDEGTSAGVESYIVAGGTGSEVQPPG
ncbi:hypothetical protein MSBRW_2748 [Methanosarcina barkeri str. Wiesmoor]|uniref:Uncharacterized protein n=1 Tax=Methanosarcina barkeri str. Wiesmoor TaxID=1434109 RepID=A0A0E3LLW9_METBA|nr:hypothetical protein MSBRW_2748 [Methanosarcina barkeri str. Wiesmoor]